MALQFVSCAFNPWGDPVDPLGFDAYWVGDATGALLRYKWTDTYGPAHAGHCEPAGITDPVGLAQESDLLYVLDRSSAAVYQLKHCFGQLPAPLQLPEAITDPSALCSHGGNWFVSDAADGAIYEFDATGALVAGHALEDFGPRSLTGIAFLGDNLFAASDAN